MTMSIQQIRFDERIATLLKESGLPVEDLSGLLDVVLFSYVVNNELRGVVGVEQYGSCGLLRSLAVAPGHRGEGVGEALLEFAERAATMNGVTQLFLLTTTAELYFLKHGYGMADRTTAPEAIARTRQFTELCPESSALMVKRTG